MPEFRVVQAALEADGRAWAEALAGGAWRAKARRLKHDGATTVYRARLLDRDVVIKSWRLGPTARLQSLFGATRAQRHWRGAALLRKAGIPTAWTWALLRGRLDGAPTECLVMEAVPGKSVLHRLADNDLSIRQQHAVAAALGAQIASLAKNLLYNRDHKPSNLILTDPGPASVAISVIDCVDIRRGQFWPDEMLASLLIETLGVGLAPRLALRMRVAHASTRNVPEHLSHGQRAWLRETWRSASKLVRDHGDPTPRVNPLSES
jgi:tRNA A-37 threonylcarbamoyl transferase component Bud32